MFYLLLNKFSFLINGHKTPYGYTPVDRARFDKPLVYKSDVATFDSAPKDSVSVMTVESNANSIQRDYNEGLDELRTLKGVLERIVDVGCVDCWVVGTPHNDSDPHPRSGFFFAHLNQLRQLRMTYNLHWPYCFHCWVPLRDPLNHPPPTPNCPLDTERCVFRPKDVVSGEALPVIPWIVAFIFGRREKESDGRTYLEGVASKLGVSWRSIRQLCDWLREPVDDLARVPNPIRFVNAFFEVY